MKVLLWSGAFWPALGGLEVLTRELALGLKDSDFEVEVLTATPGPSRMEGIRIHRLPFVDALNCLERLGEVVAELRNLMTRMGPDLLHLHGLPPLALLPFLPDSAPRILTIHGAWVPELDDAVAPLLQQVEQVVGCSRHTSRHIERFLGDRESLTIPNALPRPDLAVRPLPEKPVLLTLGRLSHEKGYDLAIRAAAELRQDFAETKLRILGAGPERQALESLAAQLEVEVEFLGKVEHQRVGGFIGESSLVLVPSRREGFGLSALDAAWAGRAVVGTRVGGLVDVVSEGRTGYLVPVEDFKALARAVGELLRSPSQLKSVGERARELAESKFCWHDFLGAHLELYRNWTTSQGRWQFG